jgi:CRP-like cAMP-binding protein
MEDIKKITADFLLSEESLHALQAIKQVFHLKKYQYFLRENEVCNYWGYVDSGLLRIFYYKDNRDITEYFMPEGAKFSSLESYFKRIPSHLIIEALEPSSVFAFHYDDFEKLCKENFEIEKYFRKSLEESLIVSQHRLDSLQFETAQEKYDNFIKNFPQLILQVPSVYIASYLGITPETLSRVRAKHEKK